MSSYGIGQGLAKGAHMAVQMVMAGMDARQRNRRLDIEQQWLDLNREKEKRTQNLKRFGDPTVWIHLQAWKAQRSARGAAIAEQWGLHAPELKATYQPTAPELSPGALLAMPKQ